ncbi:MAG: hypothetical protein K8J31_04250 [Anaerolineae bacterium]|nr:hypothetical protein [Anaerolineae bacterium]
MVTNNHEAKHPEPELMPRREFIRKSLVASGGAFVSMGTLGKISLPELTASMKPRQPSSGDEKDDGGWKPSSSTDNYGGRYGISRLESAVETDLDQ